MTKGLLGVSGGRRLSLCPSLVVSCSCFASSRLCIANASKGDSSGGTSPATCTRGDRSGFEPDEVAELFELDRRSSMLGRLSMAAAFFCATRPGLRLK